MEEVYRAKVWCGGVVMLPLVLESGSHALFRYPTLTVFTNLDALRVLSSKRVYGGCITRAPLMKSWDIID